jgi:histidine triad (HIT) family protein
VSTFHYEAGCDFCAIAKSDDSDAEIVWEAETWVAFFPLSPATPGHTLIIPRTHVTDLWQVEQPLDAQLIHACVQMGRAIQRAIEPDGMNLITSAGKTAEQTVFHLHLHVVPRWHNDGFGQIWPSERRYANAALEASAEKIHNTYKALEQR